MKEIIYKLIFKHPRVKYCSQTIYEALLGCIKMFEATNEECWRQRADKIIDILIEIQQPDGGFDIGYEFNFGLIHKKGDSTSPELVALQALSNYALVFNQKEKIEPFAKKAAEWIKKHAIQLETNVWAIPYSPYTTKEIMVYNGTSFACGALGYYISVFEVQDIKLNNIYKGMVNYLEKSLYSDDLEGRFWYYPVQERKDISKEMLNKVDYYHQMQQVEIHSNAQQFNPVEQQLKIIEDCCDYIIHMGSDKSIIPYTNSTVNFSGNIHVWGLCSVSSGFIEASKLIEEKKEEYLKMSKKVIDWIIKYSWNGNYFEPILSESGVPSKVMSYMVRSDAWVFNSFSLYYKEVDKNEEIKKIIETCYKKMEKVNFSGPESHASSKRKKVLSKIITWILTLKK